MQQDEALGLVLLARGLGAQLRPSWSIHVGQFWFSLRVLTITPLICHVILGSLLLTAAFIRIQRLADERRRTAAGIEVLYGPEEGQEIVVGRHLFFFFSFCSGNCRYSQAEDSYMPGQCLCDQHQGHNT
jgi:hypothetical protein